MSATISSTDVIIPHVFTSDSRRRKRLRKLLPKFLHSVCARSIIHRNTAFVIALKICIGVLLETLTVAQMVNKFPPFMDIEGLCQSSQKPAAGPYSDPDESRPHTHSLFLGPNQYYHLNQFTLTLIKTIPLQSVLIHMCHLLAKCKLIRVGMSVPWSAGILVYDFTNGLCLSVFVKYVPH